MQIIAPINRALIFISLGSVLTVVGCSSGNTTSCANPGFYGGGGPSGALVSPTNGVTGVSTSAQTFVFSELTQYTIVLKPANGSGYVKTMPTALPSPFQSAAPGSAGTAGDYAVSVPALSANTTYTAGTLSENVLAQCVGDEQFYTFGSFTTR